MDVQQYSSTRNLSRPTRPDPTPTVSYPDIYDNICIPRTIYSARYETEDRFRSNTSLKGPISDCNKSDIYRIGSDP